MFNQKLATFHWEMIEMVMEGEKNAQLVIDGKQNSIGEFGSILVLAPRDHAKTTLYGETIPLWKIGKDPSKFLGQVISSTAPNANKRVGRIKSCIRYNQRYVGMFGVLYPGNDKNFKWSDTAIEVKIDKERVWELYGSEERDPTMAGYGITTSVEGGRATDQCFDDVVSRENSKTQTGRADIKEKFWMSFEPMLLPIGVKRIIGTRYYPEDLYGELIEVLDDEGIYTHMYTGKEEMPEWELT